MDEYSAHMVYVFHSLLHSRVRVNKGADIKTIFYEWFRDLA